MPCRRELFDTLTKALDELEAATVGPDGFVNFVAEKYFSLPNKSKRIRETRTTLTETIKTLRERVGLLAAELDPPAGGVDLEHQAQPPASEGGPAGDDNQAKGAEGDPPLPPPPAGPVEGERAARTHDGRELPPIGPDESVGEYVARTGLQAASYTVVDGATVFDLMTDEESEEADRIIEAVYASERGADGAPKYTRAEALAISPKLAARWDEKYAPAEGGDGGPFDPATPAPPPVAYGVKGLDGNSAENAKGITPEQPAPPPAPAPAVPVIAKGSTVELIDFRKLTKAHDGAWEGNITERPDDIDSAQAFIASRHIVLNVGAIYNRRSVGRIVDKAVKGFDQSKLVPQERLRAHLARIDSIETGDFPLQVDAGKSPEPVAFTADGTDYVMFAHRSDASRRITVRADYFVFVRQWLNGNKLRWFAQTEPLPSNKGKGWLGIVARDASGGDGAAGRILALVTVSDFTLTPDQAATLIVQRTSPKP